MRLFLISPMPRTSFECVWHEQWPCVILFSWPLLTGHCIDELHLLDSANRIIERPQCCDPLEKMRNAICSLAYLLPTHVNRNTATCPFNWRVNCSGRVLCFRCSVYTCQGGQYRTQCESPVNRMLPFSGRPCALSRPCAHAFKLSSLDSSRESGVYFK